MAGPNLEHLMKLRPGPIKNSNKTPSPPTKTVRLSLSLTRTMAGKQVAGDGLSANLAGMSKNQLYDIMSQMKVSHSLYRYISL
jgi:hypothetical protein